MEHMHITDAPDLEHAVLVAAFAGWNDAASAATWAIKYLVSQWDAQPIADIDPEIFYDFSESRPHVRISNGSVRRLHWPANRFFVVPRGTGRAGAPSRDTILLLGEEPQLRWRTFCQEIIELCHENQVDDVVLLGSLVAEVPHTAPVQISGTASRQPILRRMPSCGIERASYRGTTGVLTAIQDAAHKSGLSTSSLWGVAPHYISAAPNLAVAEALLRKLDLLYGLDLRLNELARAAQRFTARVSSLVAQDPDVSAYVRELERRGTDITQTLVEGELDGSASLTIEDDSNLPSPEQAIRTAEDFLRQFRERGSD